MKRGKFFITILAIALLTFAPGIVSMAPQSAGSGEWKKNNIGWWYENTDGSYSQNSWQKINNVWYYFNGSGYMQTGWIKLYNIWYYLRTDGAMHTGWIQLSGKWYYLDSSGAMKTGWIQSGGKWYYLYSNGAMAVNTTIDGYYVNSNGAWVNNASGNTSTATTSGTTAGSSVSVTTISSNVTRDWTEIMALADSIYSQYYNEIKAMHTGLNEIRAAAGKSALELDETLTKSAIARGIHMISYGYFSHYYNNELHINVTNSLYNIDARAENIAYTTKTSDTGATLNLNWKNSSGHYANMIGSYTKVGIAYVPNDKNQIYGVQLFK